MPVDEPEMIDIDEEAVGVSAEAEIISESVSDAPIVDAEPVTGDSPLEESVTEAKPARKRKAAPSRAGKAKTPRAAKPRARKSPRTTTEA
jgi:hypothetical protein